MINNNRWATVALLLAAMGFSSVSNAALVSRLGGLIGIARRTTRA